MAFATVLIECEGGFPERFLSEAQNSGVMLWDITRRDIALVCRCHAADYVALRPIAKRACVRMRVRERHGVWFRVRRFRYRMGLALGLLLFVCLLQMLSARVWVIRVNGNEQVSDAQIAEVVRSLGVREGAEFSKVDLPTVQLTSLERLPNLVWLTVNREGSVACVEVRERTPAQPIATGQPANVVAARDGVIVSVDCQSGQAAVKAGDAVTSGSLLIGGVVDSKVGPILKQAQGTVLARTQRELAVTVPFDEAVEVEAVDAVFPSVYLLGLRIPLYTSGAVPNSQQHTTRLPLRAYGKELPIGMEYTRYVSLHAEHILRSEQEAYDEALARLSQKREEWGDAVRVEEERISAEKTQDGWTVRGQYTCIESIGESKPLQMHDKKG